MFEPNHRDTLAVRLRSNHSGMHIIWDVVPNDLSYQREGSYFIILCWRDILNCLSNSEIHYLLFDSLTVWGPFIRAAAVTKSCKLKCLIWKAVDTSQATYHDSIIHFTSLLAESFSFYHFRDYVKTWHSHQALTALYCHFCILNETLNKYFIMLSFNSDLAYLWTLPICAGSVLHKQLQLLHWKHVGHVISS